MLHTVVRQCSSKGKGKGGPIVYTRHSAFSQLYIV